MKKSFLIEGAVLVLLGIAFILAAVFTETVYDGLLWGFGGGALGPGLSRVIRYFYWSRPQNAERYQEILERKEINVHDELNEKLRDKSGRIAYLTGLFVICIAEVVFALLGAKGVITDHRIIVWFLFSLLIFQVAAGVVAYHLLRRQY